MNTFLNGTLNVIAPLPSLAYVYLSNLRAIRGSLPNFTSQRLRSLYVWGCGQQYDSQCYPQNLWTYGVTPVCACMSEGPLPSLSLPALTAMSISSLYSSYGQYYVGGAVVVPTSLFPASRNLPAVNTLTLSSMQGLFGSLPSASAYPALTQLMVQSCGMNGSLPALPSRLVSITISNTPMTGTLDALASSGFTSLGTLSLTSLQLSGPIPTALVPALNRFASCDFTGSGLGCPLPANITQSCRPGTSICTACKLTCGA